MNFGYLLNRNVVPGDIHPISEIQAVVWENSNVIRERLGKHDGNYCIQMNAFERLIRCIEQK